MKIKPYQFEHRYKLGATFALVGRHKEAYDWLRSLQKRGFEGDAGYYFWLSHSAYFSGHEEMAREAYATLIEMDPTKVGYEPWKDVQQISQADSLEQDQGIPIGKIRNAIEVKECLGFIFLENRVISKKSSRIHTYIDVEKLSKLEQFFWRIVSIMNSCRKPTFDQSFMRALETTELIYGKYRPLDKQGDTSFSRCGSRFVKLLLARSYPFRNPAAIALRLIICSSHPGIQM